ncbi:MAG TPA: hypothetical protein DCR21_05010, partial [Succinivibrionaceae bacterium]|nr:hypothetical protein [Succinivibrionaceae bacterium]
IFHKVTSLFLQKWYRAFCKVVHTHEGASLSALQPFENAKLGQNDFKKKDTLSFLVKNTRAGIYFIFHKVTSLFFAKVVRIFCKSGTETNTMNKGRRGILIRKTRAALNQPKNQV